MEIGKTFLGGYEKLEFREIVLKHIQNILHLSLQSNTGDKSSLYISAVESLSDVLLPFYDKQIQSEVDKIEKELDDLSKTNETKMETLSRGDYSDYHWKYVAKKRLIYRKLFKNLNILLKRNDYLKSAVYGEQDKDEVAEDVEEL